MKNDEKFADCVCVLITKHSFESFMCLILFSTLAAWMQGNSSLASLQHHEHNSLVSPATSWMASRRAESIVAKVTEAPSWIPVWTRWTVVSSGMWVADTSTGYSCFFSLTSTPAQHAPFSPLCTIPLLTMLEVHSPDNLPIMHHSLVKTCLRYIALTTSTPACQAPFSPSCTIPLSTMAEVHSPDNLHTYLACTIPSHHSHYHAPFPC